MTEFDPAETLRVLNRHGVRFVLIGGLAAAALGAPVATRDVDICYERSPENVERLVAALRELDARLRVARADEELPFDLHPRTILAGDSFTFVTRAGAVDVLGTPSGTSGFDGLEANADELTIADGVTVKVASLADLIGMKRSSGRPKDSAHLLVLEALRDELERGR